MSYNDKKIGKQIASYKVEMCKSKTTTNNFGVKLSCVGLMFAYRKKKLIVTPR